MDSFEDLGLGPDLVEALAAEGFERPTPLQEAALPVVRRGNNVAAAAGPGAGTLVAYGVGLLDRLEPGHPGPGALVLAPFAEAARRLAGSLGRIAARTGHGVAALGSPWALPERAQILFATPEDLLARIRRSDLDLDAVKALVIDGAATIHAVGGREAMETVLESIPEEAQRVVMSLPFTEEVADLVKRHVRRALHVPPRPVEGEGGRSPVRGAVAYRVVDEPREDAALALVSELLDPGEVRRVVLYVATEDRAADLADHLTLHGYAAGAPGTDDVPVWLAVDELEALSAVEAADGLAVVSVDVPAGPDALDRRHGSGRGGHVLVLARELAHLKDTANRTGYQTIAVAAPASSRGVDDLEETLGRVETALAGEDVGAYLQVLEPLLERHDSAEVAAALLALLRKKSPGLQRPARSTGPTPGTAWARLFVSIGHRDGAGPGDIVGAIIGEARVEASRVGRIDMKDSFSVVEVEASVAEKVIAALNGTTVRGRSLRVDYDRVGRSERGAGRGGARRPGPRPEKR